MYFQVQNARRRCGEAVEAVEVRVTMNLGSSRPLACQIQSSNSAVIMEVEPAVPRKHSSTH